MYIRVVCHCRRSILFSNSEPKPAQFLSGIFLKNVHRRSIKSGPCFLFLDDDGSTSSRKRKGRGRGGGGSGGGGKRKRGSDRYVDDDDEEEDLGIHDDSSSAQMGPGPRGDMGMSSEGPSEPPSGVQTPSAMEED